MRERREKRGREEGEEWEREREVEFPGRDLEGVRERRGGEWERERGRERWSSQEDLNRIWRVGGREEREKVREWKKKTL